MNRLIWISLGLGAVVMLYFLIQNNATAPSSITPPSVSPNSCPKCKECGETPTPAATPLLPFPPNAKRVIINVGSWKDPVPSFSIFYFLVLEFHSKYACASLTNLSRWWMTRTPTPLQSKPSLRQRMASNRILVCSLSRLQLRTERVSPRFTPTAMVCLAPPRCLSLRT